MCKSMIFHYPGKIKSDGVSASTIRPKKMIEAFESIGFKVYLVVGSKKERKKSSEKIKQMIQSGKKFSFVYSESLTFPTLLSEPSHLPFLPSIDFGFFSYCQSNEIPVGLFYRDIYWRMSDMKNSRKFTHRIIKKLFYYIDLYFYKKLDVLYLPSIEMSHHVPIVPKEIIKELPPGLSSAAFNPTNKEDMKKENNIFKILYVGGMSDGYPMQEFIDAIPLVPNITLTICTRKEDWEVYKNNVTLNDKVNVVHASGEELALLYKECDICSLVFKPQIWRSFAFPFKFFEYISYHKPILAIGNTPPARMIEKYSLGLVGDYNLTSLVELLRKINREELNRFSGNSSILKSELTWEKRAYQVCTDLMVR